MRPTNGNRSALPRCGIYPGKKLSGKSVKQMKTTDSSDDKLLLFLRLYNEHYRLMCIYIKTLMPNENNESDIMQEVSLFLWKNFDSFYAEDNQENKAFVNWAFKAIQIEVLKWRKKRYRDRMVFGDELLTAVAERISSLSADQIDTRYELLIDCTKKLPEKLHDLVDKRFFGKMTAQEIADKINKSLASVYKQLEKARTLLRNCVEKSMNLR